MEMQNLTSTIAKRTIFALWLLLGIVAVTSATRLLDEQLIDLIFPQGAPEPNHVPNTDLTFTFFMHDILRWSNPSARPITGIVNSSRISSQLPFAKPNGVVLPLINGVQGNNAGNIPFITGLSSTTSNVFQNNGMNGARFYMGSTIEKLMFGTMIVVDDELTQGPELSSGRVGKAQGFYVSSFVDSKSQVMALTAMLESGGYVDTICFFGVHLLGVSESQVAVMGGTGKLVNAKGYAIIRSLPSSLNHHQSEEVETVVQFTVYVAY